MPRASTTVSQLEAVNDPLIGHFVDRCRRDGRTWSQISTALGVSASESRVRICELLRGYASGTASAS